MESRRVSILGRYTKRLDLSTFVVHSISYLTVQHWKRWCIALRGATSRKSLYLSLSLSISLPRYLSISLYLSLTQIQRCRFSGFIISGVFVKRTPPSTTAQASPPFLNLRLAKKVSCINLLLKGRKSIQCCNWTPLSRNILICWNVLH